MSTNRMLALMGSTGRVLGEATLTSLATACAITGAVRLSLDTVDVNSTSYNPNMRDAEVTDFGVAVASGIGGFFIGLYRGVVREMNRPSADVENQTDNAYRPI